MAATRRAGTGDAPAIAAVHVKSWQAAYRGLMPDEYLDGLDVGERTERWRRILSSGDGAVVVADDRAGRIVGFCSVMPSRDADASPTTGEIAAIYVDPEHSRRGLGTALLADAFEHAASRGFTTLTLWVLDGNHRAQRFYESRGFSRDGAAKVEDRWGQVALREIRYRCPTAVRAT